MFDWSNVKQHVVVDQLLELSSKLCNHIITPEDFHEIISKFLKKTFPIIVTLEWDNKVKNQKVMIGGSYYSDYDEYDRKCIELNFYYNPNISKFKITKHRYHNICTLIADTILHEIIHMRQYRRRDFKPLPNYTSFARSSSIREEQSYLGCTDEIDAYGFNIACELLHKYDGNTKSVIKHLSLDLKKSRKSGGSWKMYLKSFEHDHNHEIIKRLKKKIIRYLPRAQSGKPFKSRDWICH
jgi:hypothetical protein